MEQQCVYFHTEKEFSTANTILETDGVEILFAAESVEIPIRNLTAEEKDAWYDSLINEMVESLPGLERSIKSLEIQISVMQEQKNDLSEIQRALHKDKDNRNAIKTLLASMRKSTRTNLMRGRRRFRPFDFSMRDLFSDTVECSCIIAKKNENIIRYIEFLANKDPIVTISGPNAMDLKPGLEQKF